MYPLANFAKTDNSIDIRFGYFRDLDDGLIQSVFQILNLLLQKFYRWGRIRFCRRRYSATCDTQLQMLTWLYDRFITTTSFLNIQLRSIYASGLKSNLIENQIFLWNCFFHFSLFIAKLNCKNSNILSMERHINVFISILFYILTGNITIGRCTSQKALSWLSKTFLSNLSLFLSTLLCASACIKINSHFRENIFCNLARFSAS